MTLDPQNNNNSIDFSSVLAAAVHDMKNSLCLLIQSLEDISQSLPPEAQGTQGKIANLHYEANRINTSLVQVLSLYRAQLDTLPINIDSCFLDDLLNDIVASNAMYAQQRGITVDIDCDAELNWYLDPDLIYLLVNDVVINGLRYGKSKIKISTFQQAEALVIRVEDDGPGYPESMLVHHDKDPASFDVSHGRTGLGLYFAHMIANAHCKNNQRGHISLYNGGVLGGSVFEVTIP
jgi:signal transduction histidine kinase